jgi:hypothetical protein
MCKVGNPIAAVSVGSGSPHDADRRNDGAVCPSGFEPDAGQLRQLCRLGRVHPDRHGVEDVQVLELDIDRPAQGAADLRDQRARVEPTPTGHLRAGRSQAGDAAGVGGQRRILELDDPQAGGRLLGRGVRCRVRPAERRLGRRRLRDGHHEDSHAGQSGHLGQQLATARCHLGHSFEPRCPTPPRTTVDDGRWQVAPEATDDHAGAPPMAGAAPDL